MTFLDELKEKRTIKMKTKTKKLPAPKPPIQQKKAIVRLMLWALPTLLQAIAIGVLLLFFRS